jgi:hypothetical protein
MTLNRPYDADFGLIGMLARELTCDLNAAGGTEKSLYTVPAGASLIVDHVCMHTFSADATAAVVTFGKTGGTCDEFLGNQTLTGITASFATQSIECRIVPNATPVANTIFTAAQVFAMEITTAAGVACTCTVEVWGHLF